MSLETRHFYDFGNFRIDPVERVLLRNGKPVPLTPKAFQLLTILVENHGHVVEKEKLMSEIWTDSFVEDGNLAFNARSLRKLFDDDARHPNFIETIPRRGYRFIAEVRPVEVSDEHTGAEESVPCPNGSQTAVDNVLSINRNGSQRSGAVFALADWRTHTKAIDNEGSNEFVPENGSEKSQEIEVAAVPPLVKNRRKFYFYVLTGLIAIVILAAGGYSLYLFASAKNTGSFSMAKVTRITSNGKTKFAAVSPDGKFVAYVLDEGDHQGIRLKNIATGSDVEILPPEPTTLGSLTFSPDGNHLYYGAKGKLYQLPVLGGAPKKILEPYYALHHNSISFSPDHKQFAFVRNTSGGQKDEVPAVFIAGANGENERMLASGLHLGTALYSAAWSPDGRTIACAAEKADGKYEVIFVRVADGIALSIPSRRWVRVAQVIWQPNGEDLLAIASDQHHTFRLWELTYPTGEARKLADDPYNYQSISLTPDGRSMVAARAEQESHIWVMPAEDTSQARQLTDGFEKYDGVFSIGWLPGGKLIYEAIPDEKGEFFTVDVSGGGSKQIAADVLHSAASPDGNYLVFTHDDSDGEGLFRLNVADGERKRLTTGKEMWPTFSPDGKSVIFNRFGEEVAVWRVSIDGGEAVKLTNYLGLPVSPTVSPDGKLIAFYRGKTGTMSHRQLSIIPFEGGEIVKAFNMPTNTWEVYAGKAPVQWTPDGQAVSYVVHRDGVSNIWRQSMGGGEPVQMTNFTSGLIFNFAYSPDGKQLSLSRGTVSRDVVLIKNPQ
jgi:eukaryotic-like serine/threonine-protein kinase